MSNDAESGAANAPAAADAPSTPIPILGGTGALGYGLAVRWAGAGAEVVIGSRDAQRAEQAAEAVREKVPGSRVEGLENDAAAKRGPIVFLTVPFRAQSETLNNLRHVLEPGQTLVDCTVPLAAAVSGKATRILGVWQGSAAEQAQEMVPDGVTVVSALHTVGAPTLSDPEAVLDEDVLVCGDRKRDKSPVARLIELIAGLRAVNAGPLETARIAEQLTPLLISVNVRYKAHAGIKLVGLPDGDPWA
jgi:8-hydroxy-5-deazaflavin:NADPH oxidoreductase